jgi:hypothetical protein
MMEHVLVEIPAMREREFRDTFNVIRENHPDIIDPPKNRKQFVVRTDSALEGWGAKVVRFMTKQEALHDQSL